MESTKQILAQSKQILKEVGKYKTNKVAVEINGKLMYMAEYEIRALQVLAKRKAEESKEGFDEFCKSVVVYSGRHKRTSKHIMKFRPNGRFSNEFEEGFFMVNSNLAFQLF